MKLNTKKLQLAMARKQWNSKQLAKAAGITFNTICNYLAGRSNPKPELLGRLAKSLDVDPETLID